MKRLILLVVLLICSWTAYAIWQGEQRFQAILKEQERVILQYEPIKENVAVFQALYQKIDQAQQNTSPLNLWYEKYLDLKLSFVKFTKYPNNYAEQLKLLNEKYQRSEKVADLIQICSLQERLKVAVNHQQCYQKAIQQLQQAPPEEQRKHMLMLALLVQDDQLFDQEQQALMLQFGQSASLHEIHRLSKNRQTLLLELYPETVFFDE